MRIIKNLSSGIKRSLITGILVASLLGTSLGGGVSLSSSRSKNPEKDSRKEMSISVKKQEPKLYDYVIRHPGRDGYTTRDGDYYNFGEEKYFVEENDLGLTNDGRIFLADKDALNYAQEQGKQLCAVGITKGGKAEIIGNFDSEKDMINVPKAFDYIGLAVKKGKENLEDKLEVIASVPSKIKDIYSSMKEKSRVYGGAAGKTLSKGTKKVGHAAKQAFYNFQQLIQKYGNSAKQIMCEVGKECSVPLDEVTEGICQYNSQIKEEPVPFTPKKPGVCYFYGQEDQNNEAYRVVVNPKEETSEIPEIVYGTEKGENGLRSVTPKRKTWFEEIINPGDDEINAKFYHRKSPLEEWNGVEHGRAEEFNTEIKKHSTKYHYPKNPLLEEILACDNLFGILHTTSLDNLLIQPDKGYEAKLYGIDYVDENDKAHKTNQYLLVLQNEKTKDIDSILVEVYLNTDAKRLRGYSILGLAEVEDPFNITPQPLEGETKNITPREWAKFLKDIYQTKPGDFHEDGRLYAKEKGLGKFAEIEEVDVENIELQELNLRSGGFYKENQPSKDGKVSGYAIEFKYNSVKEPTIFEFERGGLHLLWLPHNYWTKLNGYDKINVTGFELNSFHSNAYVYKNLLIKMAGNPNWELYKGFIQGILSIGFLYNANYVPPSHGATFKTPTPAGGYVQGNIGQ